MFWLIFAIFVVGYFIYAAIDKNTRANATIALVQQEQAQAELLSSPEYRHQKAVSEAYFEYLSNKIEYDIWITQDEIKLQKLPDWVWDPKPDNGNHFLTSSKEKYDKSKKEGKIEITLVTKSKIKEWIKAKIDDNKKQLKAIDSEYRVTLSEHPGFQPESIEVLVEKYGLNVPYAGEDWVQAEGAYGRYKEQLQDLHKLRVELSTLSKV